MIGSSAGSSGIVRQAEPEYYGQTICGRQVEVPVAGDEAVEHSPVAAGLRGQVRDRAFLLLGPPADSLAELVGQGRRDLLTLGRGRCPPKGQASPSDVTDQAQQFLRHRLRSRYLQGGVVLHDLFRPGQRAGDGRARSAARPGQA